MGESFCKSFKRLPRSLPASFDKTDITASWVSEASVAIPRLSRFRAIRVSA
jgi:hypothetical protein